MGARTPGQLGESQTKVDEGFGMEIPSHGPQETSIDYLVGQLRANGSAVIDGLFGPQAAGPNDVNRVTPVIAATPDFSRLTIEEAARQQFLLILEGTGPMAAGPNDTNPNWMTPQGIGVNPNK